MGKYTLDFTANEINNRLSKLNDTPISMELVWENASPTSEFGAQDITINLSDYSLIEIEFKISTTQERTFREKSLINTGGFACFIYGSVDAGIYGGYRYFTPFDDKINFSTCWRPTTSTEAVDNTYCIPIKVYGIKGVQ